MPNMIDNKLVVMDVEGVVIPKRHYLLVEAAKMLSVFDFLKLLLFGLLYEIGLLHIGSALRRSFSLFRGRNFTDFFESFKETPLIPDVEEFIGKLKGHGFRVAFISSGLPEPFVKYLARKLSADFAFGLELGVRDGRLTGEVKGDLLEYKGKASVLERILAEQGLMPSDCILIVDDRNNLPMFPLSSLRVGYNPDYRVSSKSDYVVKGSLLNVLPLITSEKPTVTSSSTFERNEVPRKLIHMASSLTPLICIYLLTRGTVAMIISIVLGIYVVSELVRLRNIEMPLFYLVTEAAASKSELNEFVTSPITFALGIVFSLLFFPEPVGYAAVIILTLGDSTASFFGKLLGSYRYPYNKGKGIGGTVIGFIFAFLGCLFFINPTRAFIGALAGMFVETLPLPLDDNLTIPLVAGAVMLLPI